MGDFNAKVGKDNNLNSNVMGPYGMGKLNERGERLLDFCYVNDLFISNTKFRQRKPSNCWTWESPDLQTHNQIDYILVARKLMPSVQNSRAFPSGDIGSDHQLVMANTKLKLKKRTPHIKIRKINSHLLLDPTTQMDYNKRIEEKRELERDLG